MKRKLIAILLMCILSITACSKEPQESVETPVVVEDVAQPDISESVEQKENTVEDIEEPIYFSKEETGFLELGDTPVICELDSNERTVEAKVEVTETVIDKVGCNETDVQIKIDDTWFHPVEKEYLPQKVFLGNLKNGEEIDTLIFLDHTDETGIYSWVTIYDYNNDKLEKVGEIVGWIKDNTVFKDSNEEIKSIACLIGVVQKSFYEGQFVLSDGKIIEIEQDFYDILEQESQDITLLEELIVYESPDVNSKQFTLQPQKVNFTRSDGMEWMEIIAEDGTKGYARADGFMMLDMDNRISTEIFDGLAYWG